MALISEAGLLDAIASLDEKFSGNLGVAAMNMATQEEVCFRADESFPTASAIKVPILVEVVRQQQAGLLSLDERVMVDADQKQGGGGVLKLLDPGANLSLHDLATLMIVISDNTATRILVERVGGQNAVNDMMRSLGLETIVLHPPVDWPAAMKDIRRVAEASPRELSTLVGMLARHEVIDAQSSDLILGIMERTQHLNHLPRYMSVISNRHDFPWLTPKVIAACKTGASGGCRVDMGLVALSPTNSFAYCVATCDSADRSSSPEQEGTVVIGLVGRLLLQYWWDQGDGPPPLLDTPYCESFGLN